MMQFANKDLAKVNGLTFYRLMGSGKGEVLILSQIGLFIAYFKFGNLKLLRFSLSSDLIKRYADHTDELFTLYMKNISAGGT
jgi:hypothetical protein